MNDKSKNRGGGKGRPPSGGAGRGRGPGARGDSSTPRGFHKARTPAPRGPSGDEEGKKAFRPRRPAESRGPSENTGEKRSFKPRGEKSFGDRQPGDRPFSSRPPRDNAGEGKRPFKPRGDRPAGDRPYSARPARDGSSDEKRSFRPRGERPADERPRGERPYGERSGKPMGFRGKTRSFSAPKVNPGERIAKVMARVGLCSRRDAEEWILAGRVMVNDEILKSPALDVLPTDKVLVDGVPLPMRERTRLFLYHKERGLVTTARDPEGRPTVFSRLPKNLPRVITIGRLDINTEGLLLLTNDGGLARIIELPETGWLRRYRVRCYGEISQPVLDSLRGGITVEGMNYGPIEATLDREKGDNVWLTLGLREGKNREVKRVLEHLGLQVNRLIRVSFGPFQLGELDEGAVEEVKTGFLRDQLGPALIAESGVDFDAPMFNHEPEPESVFEPVRERYQRSERTGPAERSDRPERGRSDDRDQRRDRPDRMRGAGPRPSAPKPSRAKGEGAPEAEADGPVRPKWRHPTEPLRSIWRAEDAEQKASTRSTPKTPRRGADPKEIRSENAEREHRRSGSIKTRSGKSVLVEKLAPSRRDEAVRETAPVRTEKGAFKPRRSRDAPPSRQSDDRPDRGTRKFSDKPSGGRGFGGKPSADRPATGRNDGRKPYGGGKASGGSGRGSRPPRAR